jgi:hypothetical protein
MKAALKSLFLLAVAGVAAAQTPYPQGTPGSLPGPGTVSNAGQLRSQSIGSAVQVPAQAPTVFGQPLARPAVTQINGAPQGVAGANCCPATNCAAAPTCCQPCPTCERVPATRDIRHVFYCKTCEPFCIPVCSCCISHWFGCGSCCCEGPYAKYFLVRRVQIEKCPITRCVPTCAPACGEACIQPPR